MTSIIALVGNPNPGGRTTRVAEALANLEDAGLDVVGDGFAKIEVEVTEGGN